jgi:hypothetical protein
MFSLFFYTIVSLMTLLQRTCVDDTVIVSPLGLAYQ